MKKKTPNIIELVNRYAKCIELRSNKEVNQSAKQILIHEWKGKEAVLYEILKRMENQDVQIKNIERKIEKRTVQFQCGSDILGFPIYEIHEVIFENDTPRKHSATKNISKQRFLISSQYTIKQH